MSEAFEGPVWKLYLAEMRSALAPLSNDLREDILEETRCHIRDRIEAGASDSEIMNSLGDPALYAAKFLDAFEINNEKLQNTPPHMLKALLSFGAHSLFAGIALVGIIVMWAPTLLMLLFSVLKVLNPLNVGLWRGGDDYFMGVNNSAGAEEVLGWWLLVITAIMTVAAWRGSKALALNVRKQISA